MSYNGSGTFQINTSGQPVVAGTVISSTAFNALTADLATGLSTAITKDGQTTTTARIPFAAGINSSLATDSSSTSTGSIITAGGVGIVKNLYVGANTNIAGTLGVTGVATFSAAPIYSSLTASSAVATDASKGLVSVTNTGTGNNVLATSPTLVTPILGTPQSGSLVNCTDTNYTGFKNRIINGAMQIWQRGTTASLSNSFSYLTADRWETDMGSTAAATVSQSTSVPTATTQYSLKIQRTAASTSTGNIVAAQALETANSYDLAGSSITLSFWAKCGANYSATSSILGSFVFFGTGTDQSMNNMRSNAWTSQTNASQNNTVSTTWTRFTQTVSCPAGTTQVGLQFLFSPTGTAGADDSIFITGVQLEKGSTATSFDYRPYGTELQLCQRYYETSDGLVLTTAWTTIINNVYWKVTKRATPSTITTTVTSGSGAVFASFGTGVSLVYQSVVNSVASSATVTASSEL